MFILSKDLMLILRWSVDRLFGVSVTLPVPARKKEQRKDSFWQSELPRILDVVQSQTYLAAWG